MGIACQELPACQQLTFLLPKSTMDAVDTRKYHTHMLPKTVRLAQLPPELQARVVALGSDHPFGAALTADVLHGDLIARAVSIGLAHLCREPGLRVVPMSELEARALGPTRP